MPTYTYRCDACDTTTEKRHSMGENFPFFCPVCRRQLRRTITSMPRVNWNQPAPSQGGLHPTVAQYNQDLPRLRDEFAKEKEEHVNRTRFESGDDPSG